MYELSLVKNWNVLLIDETWVKRLLKKISPRNIFYIMNRLQQITDNKFNNRIMLKDCLHSISYKCLKGNQ